MLVPANGTRLHVEIEGQGTPCFVIVVSGIPLYQRTFSEHLRRRLQLIFIDVRGSGRSDPTPHPPTLQEMVDDLEALREALGLGRVVAIGSSAPGLLALEYGLRYPDSTLGVVMNGTPPRMSGLGEEQRRFWENHASPDRQEFFAQRGPFTAEMAAAAPPGEAVARRYAHNGPLYFHDYAFDCLPYWRDCVFTPEWTDYFFGTLMANLDPTGSFPNLRVPVLLTLGRDDYVVPYTLWDPYLGQLPSLTYRLFERSGHWPHLEEQQAFDLALLDWITTISGAGSQRRNHLGLGESS